MYILEDKEMNGYQIVSEALDVIITKAPDPSVKINNMRYDAHYREINAGYILMVEAMYNPHDNINLRSFYIKKPYRGKGIARKLMETVRADYWNYDIVLRPKPFGKGTDRDKKETEEMYKHFGFIKYPHRDDRLYLPKRRKLK